MKDLLIKHYESLNMAGSIVLIALAILSYSYAYWYIGYEAGRSSLAKCLLDGHKIDENNDCIRQLESSLRGLK